jgi:hypothetical protein
LLRLLLYLWRGITALESIQEGHGLAVQRLWSRLPRCIERLLRHLAGVAILRLLLIKELTRHGVVAGLINVLEYTPVENSPFYLGGQWLRMYQRSLVALILTLLDRVLLII